MQHLKTVVRRVTRRRFQPRRIITDFERSLLISLETEFPQSRLNGCYFHFNQSLWRHIQRQGLVVPYKNDNRFQKIVRKVMALAFLPVLLVRQNFMILRQSRPTRRLILRYPAFDDWLDYVQQVYIDRNGPFNPPLWNVFDRSVDTRTNNHLEGYLLNIFRLKTTRLQYSPNYIYIATVGLCSLGSGFTYGLRKLFFVVSRLDVMS